MDSCAPEYALFISLQQESIWGIEIIHPAWSPFKAKLWLVESKGHSDGPEPIRTRELAPVTGIAG